MKIYGQYKDVQEIEVKHSGIKMNFLQQIHTLPVAKPVHLEEISRSTIEFDDIIEIYQLIGLLERVKQMIENGMGTWIQVGVKEGENNADS